MRIIWVLILVAGLALYAALILGLAIGACLAVHWALGLAVPTAEVGHRLIAASFLTVTFGYVGWKSFRAWQDTLPGAGDREDAWDDEDEDDQDEDEGEGAQDAEEVREFVNQFRDQWRERFGRPAPRGPRRAGKRRR